MTSCASFGKLKNAQELPQTTQRAVIHHFEENHKRNEDGRFFVPLPRDPQVKQLGESISSAVCRFLSRERSLQSKNKFDEFANVMNEYMDLQHAELVATRIRLNQISSRNLLSPNACSL